MKILVKVFFVFLSLSLLSCGDTIKYNYKFKESYNCRCNCTIWISDFKGRPPIDIYNKDEFVKNLNLALSSIGINNIEYMPPEKATIPKYLKQEKLFKGVYEYLDYPLGVLTIHRGMGSGNYDGIWKIILQNNPCEK